MEKTAAPLPVVIPRSEHCLSRKNIDPDALKVMVRLHRHGFKAYLVGGSVRDLLLGRQPKDFDVSTDARPGQLRKLFRNSRIIGKRFRLAHVYFRGGKIIEVSTFRRMPDQAGEGPSGDNTFGEPHEDAFRRDLTINGLFYDIGTFSILDYVGGMKDLRAGIIRTIGPPDERFREDPVRMLRVVRHTVRTGFRIEAETQAAILRNAPLLRDTNRSRLQDELRKDLEGPSFCSVLRLQWEMDLLAAYFPKLDAFLRCFEPAAESLFRPGWPWKALARIDTNPEPEPPVSEQRLVAILLPLLDWEGIKAAQALGDRPLDGGFLKGAMDDLGIPFALPRRDRERLRVIFLGWVRLLRFLREGRGIPPGFQRKAYFGRVARWHVFHQVVEGRRKEDVEAELEQAVQAGRARTGRKRRRRRKRKRRLNVS